MFHRNGRLVLLLTVLFGAVKLCESVCDTELDGTYVYCKGKNLYSVPQNFSEDLEYLDLSYNQITELNVTSFIRYPYLHTLNLSYNNISYIENGSFEVNLLLRNLSLFNNSLTEIPASVTQLEGLQILDLSNNFYTFPTLREEFSKLVELQDLSIGGPLISVVQRDDFVALQNISLQKFSLKSKSSLDIYEPGSFSVLDTEVLWLDIALDNNPVLLIHMLKDLKGKNLTTLRFRNLFEFSYYDREQDIFSNLAAINLRDLVFYRGKFNENLLRLVLQNISKSSKNKNLLLLSVDFARSLNTNKTGNRTINDLDLQNLVIKDVTNPDILRYDWTFTWFSQVDHLSIINVNFNFVPCDAWGQMTNVVTLNISSNRLQAANLFNSCKENGLPKIETFNVSNNQVNRLKTISLLTAYWPKLTHLDLADNAIGSFRESCVWGPSIKTLILRNNILIEDVFDCLPTTVEHLDMSNSLLERLHVDYFDRATNLTELILRNNKIKFIPTGWSSPNLQVLALEGNSFGVIDQGSFQNLRQLRELTAGNNPYHCTCDLNSFFTATLNEGSLSLPDWPDDYYCYHPLALLDTRIEFFSPGKLECDIRLVVAISVSVTAVVVMVLMLLCYRFDLHWYLRATCQIIQSKYRSRNGQKARDYAYHAFISYSYSDADWVRGILLPRLESATPPYKVCIHERDFLPGKWIIDNIIENIENSRKIVFVLSRNFVNSEWCNYELYFAHQRAIGHAFEDVILVVKENVCMKDLPKRFCRLRKMLRTKTYLEWPLEANRQPFFWVQLKTILGKGSTSLSGQDNISLVNETVNVGVESSSAEPMTTKYNLELPES